MNIKKFWKASSVPFKLRPVKAEGLNVNDPMYVHLFGAYSFSEPFWAWATSGAALVVGIIDGLGWGSCPQKVKSLEVWETGKKTLSMQWHYWYFKTCSQNAVTSMEGCDKKYALLFHNSGLFLSEKYSAFLYIMYCIQYNMLAIQEAKMGSFRGSWAGLKRQV